MKITAAEIEAERTPAGGWTRETLAKWGVPWPPPKGWKERLLSRGTPAPWKSLDIDPDVIARLVRGIEAAPREVIAPGDVVLLLIALGVWELK